MTGRCLRRVTPVSERSLDPRRPDGSVTETHVSMLTFDGVVVHKRKKAVTIVFVDLATPAQRERMSGVASPAALKDLWERSLVELRRFVPAPGHCRRCAPTGPPGPATLTPGRSHSAAELRSASLLVSRVRPEEVTRRDDPHQAPILFQQHVAHVVLHHQAGGLAHGR